MPQVPVMWSEWRPDLETRDTQFANDVENVFPGSNSYLPVPDLSPFGDTPVPPPPAIVPIVGLISARRSDGTWLIYAGTTQRLYRWTFSAGWTDVSRAVTGGANYNAPFGELWSWTQYGKYLIACQIGDTPQFCDVDANTNFADLTGFPAGTKAHNVRTIGEFVIFGRLVTGGVNSERKILWSSIGDPFGYTIGVNLCDEQEFPDHGPIKGLAGDKIMYVLQDRAVRLGQFLPGDTTFIWSFSQVVYDRGSVSEFAYTSVGDTLYVLCEDGFYAVSGAQLVPIGHEKVNEWFLANSDIGRRNIVTCFPAVKPYICWPYHRSAGSSMYDGVMIYNWVNQRWSKANIPAQIWSSEAISSIDLDLDTTGSEPGDNLLDSTARGLDSFAYVGGRPLVAAIDPAGFLTTLAGPNLQATLETGEAHLIPGKRAMVGDVYVLADGTAADPTVQAPGVIYDGTRERMQDDVTWGPACPIEITGSAAVYASARLHRFRHIIPRGTKWTHAQGVVADAQQDGTVA